MQNHYNLIYREEEARGDSAVRGSGPGADSVESSGTRVSDRHAAAGWRGYGAIGNRYVREGHDYREDDFAGGRCGGPRWQSNGARTPAQVACAWVLQAPGITAPIIGTTKTQQLTGVDCGGGYQAECGEVAALEKPYRPHPILGHAQPDAKTMVAK